MKAPQEILIIKPSSLGDVVHTLPCLSILRRTFSSAKIRWLVNPEWAPLLEGNPHLDEAVIFPRQEFRGLRGLLRILPWAKALRARVRADLVLDFQGLLRSALIARLCRAPGGRIVGLSDAREGARFFYDEIAHVGGVDHAVDRYVKLTALAIEKSDLPPRPESNEFEWPLPQGSPPAGFTADEPFVLLHPFSRGAGKSLTPAQVAEFCRTLAPRRVVLAGRTQERVALPENVTDLLNRTTIPELIWLIRRAAFVVSVDSGPMHIAAAITPSLLSIHTWSDPAKVGPWRPEAWVWKDGRLFQMRHLSNPRDHLECADLSRIGLWLADRLRIAAPPPPSPSESAY